MAEFIDRTGEPRRDAEIESAIKTVCKRLVQFNVSDPELTVQLPVIKDGLEELLATRQLMRDRGIKP